MRRSLVGDVGVGAGQGLERLVGLGVALAAQNGLDAFGHHGPVVLQIAVERFAVEDHLVESLHQRSQRNGGVGHRNADVAQHGRVGEVALEARDGELRREVFEEGVGDAEVALGVLEVIGLTLCGMALDPTSPALICCLKYSIEI